MDDRIRTMLNILKDYGFKVVEHWQGKHHVFITECGRRFSGSVSPSDSNWHRPFERLVKAAAKDRDGALVPKDCPKRSCKNMRLVYNSETCSIRRCDHCHQSIMGGSVNGVSTKGSASVVEEVISVQSIMGATDSSHGDTA